MESHQFSLQDILCRTLNDLNIPTSHLSEITGLTPQAVNKFRRGSGKTKIATLDSIIKSVFLPRSDLLLQEASLRSGVDIKVLRAIRSGQTTRVDSEILERISAAL